MKCLCILSIFCAFTACNDDKSTNSSEDIAELDGAWRSNQYCYGLTDEAAEEARYAALGSSSEFEIRKDVEEEAALNRAHQLLARAHSIENQLACRLWLFRNR